MFKWWDASKVKSHVEVGIMGDVKSRGGFLLRSEDLFIAAKVGMLEDVVALKWILNDRGRRIVLVFDMRCLGGEL